MKIRSAWRLLKRKMSYEKIFCESSSVEEPHLAKVTVAGSSPVSRSNLEGYENIIMYECYCKICGSSCHADSELLCSECKSDSESRKKEVLRCISCFVLVRFFVIFTNCGSSSVIEH